MADLTQTRSAVGFKTTPAKSDLIIGTSGEAINPGHPAYLKAADNKWYKARTDTAAEANVGGIVLTDATSANEPIILAGPATRLDIGATLIVGEVYALSGTDFLIAPEADLVTVGAFPCVLGIASAADTLIFQPIPSGVALP